MRKLGLLSVLLVGASVVGGTARATSTTPGWVTYRARHLEFAFSFSHPSEWKARFAGFTWPVVGNPQRLIVALSTERLHNPNCHQVPLPGGTSTTACDPILGSLPSQGVYVEWWENLSTLQPDHTLPQVPGNPTRIGGAFAKIMIDPTGAASGKTCPKQTTGAVQLRIAGTFLGTRPGGRPEIYMYACTNTTNFPRFMAQLLPMLRSVRFRPAPT